MQGMEAQQKKQRIRPPFELTRPRRRVRGFSLIEVVIVVAIVGILASIAFPSYQNVVIRNNRAVARAALTDLVARQESYYAQTKTYADNLTQLGFPSSPMFLRNNGGLAPDTGSGTPSDSIYSLRVANTNNRGFQVEAVPAPGIMQSRDTDCGTLSINAQGKKASQFSGDNCF